MMGQRAISANNTDPLVARTSDPYGAKRGKIFTVYATFGRPRYGRHPVFKAVIPEDFLIFCTHGSLLRTMRKVRVLDAVLNLNPVVWCK
jgi:hypothetical protein